MIRESQAQKTAAQQSGIQPAVQLPSAQHPIQIGAVIIGDELLTGKRRDRHQPMLIQALADRGLELSWIRIVGDAAPLLTQTFRETLNSGSWVFSFGGIGATPDDRTRPCLAEAGGVPLVRHPDFVALLETRFGADAYPNRVRMAELPPDATLIPNPINGIPGFAWARHVCVPGFPNMAEPMVNWAIDSFLAPWIPTEAPLEQALCLHGVPESRLVPLLQAMEQRYPNLRFSSLPSHREQNSRVELGVRGAPQAVAQAFAELQTELHAAGLVPYPEAIEILAPWSLNAART